MVGRCCVSSPANETPLARRVPNNFPSTRPAVPANLPSCSALCRCPCQEHWRSFTFPKASNSACRLCSTSKIVDRSSPPLSDAKRKDLSKWPSGSPSCKCGRGGNSKPPLRERVGDHSPGDRPPCQESLRVLWTRSSRTGGGLSRRSHLTPCGRRSHKSGQSGSGLRFVFAQKRRAKGSHRSFVRQTGGALPPSPTAMG